MVEAQFDDDDVVRAALEVAAPDVAPRRRLSEFSPVMEALTNLTDLLGALIRTQISLAGQNAPKIPPALRPVTAVERIRAEERRKRHLHLVEQLLPADRKGKSP